MFATPREWLAFDHEAGRATDAFEEDVPDDHEFPPRWAEPADRYDAVDILRDNLDLLAEMSGQRRRLLRVGYRLREVVVDRAAEDSIAFRVELRNGTDGHNVPTGFDAERLVWLHVTVTDAESTVVFESGDLDPNADVRDSHSVYVHDAALPADDQLFSLQSRFLVRMVRGGERGQVLVVPYSPSPLVFLRPSTRSTILTGQPPGARKQRRTIPPGTSRSPAASGSCSGCVPPTGPTGPECAGSAATPHPDPARPASVRQWNLDWDTVTRLSRSRCGSPPRRACPFSALARPSPRNDYWRFGDCWEPRVPK